MNFVISDLDLSVWSLTTGFLLDLTDFESWKVLKLTLA